MDPEKVEEIHLNTTFSINESVSSNLMNWHLFEKIMVTIFCLIGVVANGVILYVIIRFKKMHTRVNMYMVNWCLSNAAYLIFSPCSYHLFTYLERMDIDPVVLCILYEMETVTLFVNIVFVLLLTIDWYVVTYTVSCSIKYRSHFKAVVLSTWILILFFVTSFVTTCTHNIYIPLSSICIFFGFVALFVVITAVHVLKFINSKQTSTAVFKSTLSLKLATVFALCWSMGWASFFIDLTTSHNVYVLHIISLCVSDGNALINLLLLAHWDKNFLECLRVAFRCGNEGQDFEECDNHVIDSNAIQVESLMEEAA